MLGDAPPCGWRGGGCTYLGPPSFVIIMGLVMVAAGLLIWLLRKEMYPPVEPPAHEDPQPRHYHFDDKHGDRISGED